MSSKESTFHYEKVKLSSSEIALGEHFAYDLPNKKQEKKLLLHEVAHFHEMIELILFKDSCCTARIGDRKFSVDSLNLAYIPSLTLHQFIHEKSHRQEWFIIKLDPTLLQTMKLDQTQVFDSEGGVYSLSQSQFQRMEVLFSWFEESCRDKEDATIGYDLLNLIIKAMKPLMKKVGTESSCRFSQHGYSTFVPLLKKLESADGVYPTLNEAASLCSLSPFYFSRLFKKFFDMTYNHYIIQRRLSLALTLLTETEFSITDIALKTGFSDSAYFCKVFKQKIGQTPRSIRSQSYEFVEPP